MTLDEAIIHAEEVANSTSCSKCSEQHMQLATWLKELKGYKNMKSEQEIRELIHEMKDTNNTWKINFRDYVIVIKTLEWVLGENENI